MITCGMRAIKNNRAKNERHLKMLADIRGAMTDNHSTKGTSNIGGTMSSSAFTKP
jgi:hypothetical protein